MNPEIPKMTMREEQAFNDGRNAFRAGADCTGGSRRSITQRAAWRLGFDHENRIDLASKATPETRAESQRVITRLKAWATQNLS